MLFHFRIWNFNSIYGYPCLLKQILNVQSKWATYHVPGATSLLYDVRHCDDPVRHHEHPFHRDITKEVVDAFRSDGIAIGIARPFLVVASARERDRALGARSADAQ